jgi:hypothetical protein
MAKLSFKKQKKEGRYRSFSPDRTEIKADRKVVGSICEYAPLNRPEGEFVWGYITFRLIDDTSACGFKNVFLKYRPTSEEDGRRWVTEKWDVLQQKYKFHTEED